MPDFQLYILLFLKNFQTNILTFLFNLLQPMFTKNTYLLYDSLVHENCECVECYTFFKFLQKQNIKSKYIISSDNCSFETVKKETNLKDVIVINKRDDFFPAIFMSLLHTHTVISSFGFLIMFDRFLKKNKYINHVFLEHGITVLKPVVKLSYGPSVYDYFVITSSKEKETLLTLSDWNDKNIIKTGLPRLDTIKRKISNKKTIFVMFTLRNFVHDYSSESYYILKLKEFITNPRLLNILKNNNIKLKVGMHYFIRDNILSSLDAIDSNFIEIIEPQDIAKNISTSDLFVTDFSSVAFSFMYINTPVIFYRLDADCKDTNYLEKEYINYAKTKDSILYNVFYSLSQTIDKIEYYIKNNFQLEEEFIQINTSFFDYAERGHIAQNLISQLENLRQQKHF